MFVVLDEDDPEISRRSKVFTDTEVVVLPIAAFCLIFQGCEILLYLKRKLKD